LRRLGFTVAALLVVVAGCTQSAGHHATGFKTSPRPLKGAIYFSARELATFHTAEQSLIQRCMHGAGFRYEVIPPGDTVRVAAADPYQILDPKRAATDGYGLTAIAFDRLRRGRQPTDPNDALLAKLPATRKEAWHLAFSGDIRRRLTIKLPDGQSATSPADGCMFQAHRKIYGADWDTIFYRLQALTNDIVIRALKDARFLAAQRAWSACMADAGVHAVTLDDPRRQIQDQLVASNGTAAALRRIGKQELTVARKDNTCQQRAGLADAAKVAQVSAETALAGSHETELTQFRKLRAEALKQARAISP